MNVALQQGTGLQEKEEKKEEKNMGRLFRKNPRIKGVY